MSRERIRRAVAVVALLAAAGCDSPRATAPKDPSPVMSPPPPPSTPPPPPSTPPVASAPPAASAPPPTAPAAKTVDLGAAPIDVDPGVSIAQIKIGMKLSDVRALGIPLAPEGIKRVDRTGWVSGPLLVLVDGADVVTLVSVELRKSRGVRVGTKVVAPTASLASIAAQVPGCKKGRGSGGDYLDCRGASGNVVHFYGSGNADAEISVILDGALLR